MPLTIVISTLLLLLLPTTPSLADVGRAASYGPPYLPTACYGNDQSQLPANGLFAAAGVGIWDNGASCGRRYIVRCLSAAARGACISDASVQVTIVDRAGSLSSAPSVPGATLVLSSLAYAKIAHRSLARVINIELAQI